MVTKISLPPLHLERKSDLPLQFQVSWLSEKFVASEEHRCVFCAVLLLLAGSVPQAEAMPHLSFEISAASAKASFVLTREPEFAGTCENPIFGIKMFRK